MSNPKRIEPLSDSEFEFIEKRYKIAAKSFYFGMRILLAVMILMPILVVFIYRNLEFKDDLSNGQIWLYSQIITLIVYAIGFTAGYMQLLYAYTRDMKHKQKVIETVLIQEKKYMPQNDSYHFYINSEPTYSIEVDASVYQAFGINDEINIEYVRYSEIYLGYF